MCEAMSPPRPGDPLYMLWREDPLPEKGDTIETSWGGHKLVCTIDEALPSKVYDGELRRLHMTVVG